MLSAWIPQVCYGMKGKSRISRRHGSSPFGFLEASYEMVETRGSVHRRYRDDLYRNGVETTISKAEPAREALLASDGRHWSRTE